jgi:hypothetical protein
MVAQSTGSLNRANAWGIALLSPRCSKFKAAQASGSPFNVAHFLVLQGQLFHFQSLGIPQLRFAHKGLSLFYKAY